MERYEEALTAFDEAEAVGGGLKLLKGLRGWVLGLAGQPDEARQVFRELERTAAEEKVNPCVRLCPDGPGRSRPGDRVAAEGLRSARPRWFSCGRHRGTASVPTRASSS